MIFNIFTFINIYKSYCIEYNKIIITRIRIFDSKIIFTFTIFTKPTTQIIYRSLQINLTKTFVFIIFYNIYSIVSPLCSIETNIRSFFLFQCGGFACVENMKRKSARVSGRKDLSSKCFAKKRAMEIRFQRSRAIDNNPSYSVSLLARERSLNLWVFRRLM